MIPMHTRVVAIDDDEEHLQNIAWGLGKAGFCAIPYLFDAGEIEGQPAEPLTGIRLVFTDVHMTGGAPNREEIHASNIIRCLKALIAPGPYALIFWTQFPEDAVRMTAHIEQRARAAGLTPPIAYGAINKTEVFTPAQPNSDLDAQRLRELILDQVRDFRTLAVVSSWEGRVANAAARTTDRVFGLCETAENRDSTWAHLLAFLASQTVGLEQANVNVTSALDSALFPLLEDQLSLLGGGRAANEADLEPIREHLTGQRPPRCPRDVQSIRLNSSYLIEEMAKSPGAKMWDRGMVTELKGGFLDSGEFVRAFGVSARELMVREFLHGELDDSDWPKLKLHLVELGPECDHVQGKVSAHRYLLALLVPDSLLPKCKNGKAFANASIISTGAIFLRDREESHHLLISCRCFMALAPRTQVVGNCIFRLRRSLIEEVAHHYSSHSRRPGVMRFF